MDRGPIEMRASSTFVVVVGLDTAHQTSRWSGLRFALCATSIHGRTDQAVMLRGARRARERRVLDLDVAGEPKSGFAEQYLGSMAAAAETGSLSFPAACLIRRVPESTRRRLPRRCWRSVRARRGSSRPGDRRSRLGPPRRQPAFVPSSSGHRFWPAPRLRLASRGYGAQARSSAGSIPNTRSPPRPAAPGRSSGLIQTFPFHMPRLRRRCSRSQHTAALFDRAKPTAPSWPAGLRDDDLLAVGGSRRRPAGTSASWRRGGLTVFMDFQA